MALKTIVDSAAALSVWPRLGVIRLGINTGTKDKPKPLGTDYFVVDLKENPELSVLGDKPKSIDIVLLGVEIVHNWDTEAAVFRKNAAKWCSTKDDVTAKRYMDLNWDHENKRPLEGKTEPNWKLVDIPCPNNECPWRQRKADGSRGPCVPFGILKFAIPATVGQTNRAGKKVEIGEYWMTTRAGLSLKRITAMMDGVAALTAGRDKGMAGIRMRLVLREVKYPVDLNKDGNQSMIKKWIPDVELDFARLLVGDQAMLGPIMERPLEIAPSLNPAEAEEHFESADLGAAPAGSFEESVRSAVGEGAQDADFTEPGQN